MDNQSILGQTVNLDMVTNQYTNNQ